MALQYVSDQKGRKTAVILPIKEYQKMQQELEDLYCATLYDRAAEQIKAEGSEPLPLQQAIEQMNANREKAGI